MTRIFTEYVEKAKRILDENWTGKSTRPAPTLYPHQWNWDSGFIAIGRSNYDTERAIQEIESLFNAQWSNGMLPQIVFNPEELEGYFPGPDFWQTEGATHAPQGVLTSGITMPPVHAIAVEKIYQRARRQRSVRPFVERIYPKLLDLHTYLYRERDPHGEGLVYIRHPWESGVDNSPSWDVPLKRIAIDKTTLPAYTRKDLECGVDPKMRPTDDDYDRYVYLVDLFCQCDYDEARIRDVCPFLVQDPLFNSILCRANESLARLAEIIGESGDAARRWAEKTAAAIREKLWHGEHGIFDAYDLRANQFIEVDTSSGFMPLLAGAATREQAEVLYNRLDSVSFCALNQGNCFTVPNYDMQKQDFDRFSYWRGPVWVNMNWMLAQGLRRYGYTLKADSLQKDLLQLPIRFGFYEYFDSLDGTGYGSNSFSWTAALFIDLVDEFYEREEPSRRAVGWAKGIVVRPRVLNDGDEMPDAHGDELAGQLLHCIRSLRNKFYDTRRGVVDYDRLKESSDYRQYRVLANGLRRFAPACLVGRREKLAFWINLYNSLVVDGIVALGIKRSVKEVPRFFRKVKYAVGPHLFSPDEIEHGILRGNARPYFGLLPPFGPTDARRQWVSKPVDPRIHFALVCGSRSCAPIDYYEPGEVYDQLEVAAKSFVNSSEVVVLPEEGKVLVSEIFRWYEQDFGGIRGVLDFIFDYLADEESRCFIQENAERTRFEYLHYDWNLNG